MSQLTVKNFREFSNMEIFVRRFNEFAKEAYDPDTGIMPDLVENGQHPDVCFISCIDSRIPDVAKLGESLLPRHASAIIHPYRKEMENDMGSIEFAINFALDVKKVGDLILMFHTHCGAITGAFNSNANPQVNLWKELAKDVLLGQGNSSPDETTLIREIERQGLIWSLNNLQNFDSVKRAQDKGTTTLHGTMFDMKVGEILRHDPQTRKNAPFEFPMYK